MEPITIKSKMDFNTYFRISLRLSFSRIWVVLIILFVIIQALMLFDEQPFKWSYELTLLGCIVLYAFISLPVATYFLCKRNMKLPALKEVITYQINNERIELKGESFSNSTTWAHVKKAQEFEQYFVLTNKSFSIHYLPKVGFESPNDMELLKEMVKHNRIKAYFK